MFRYANEFCLVLFSTNRNCMNKIKYDTDGWMDGWMDGSFWLEILFFPVKSGIIGKKNMLLNGIFSLL